MTLLLLLYSRLLLLMCTILLLRICYVLEMIFLTRSISSSTCFSNFLDIEISIEVLNLKYVFCAFLIFSTRIKKSFPFIFSSLVLIKMTN